MVGYVNVYWNKLALKKSLLCAESRGNVHLFFVVMCYIRAGPLSGLSRVTARYHQILISPTVTLWHDDWRDTGPSSLAPVAVKNHLSLTLIVVDHKKKKDRDVDKTKAGLASKSTNS